jgi:crotonobetainyl-CoA:carnitine CoA-transferase CaiB-like acyl-CoA transferase
MTNAGEAAEIVAALVGARPYADWLEILSRGEGQWAAVQNSWEVVQDPSLRANGLIAQLLDAHGVSRELVANPVQFDETPAELTRAPQFAEHTDEVLLTLGLTDDELMQLKIDGAVT